MSMILKNAIRKAAAKRARGRLGFILRNRLSDLIGIEEREAIRKRAQNTPYLDEMLAIGNKMK